MTTNTKRHGWSNFKTNLGKHGARTYEEFRKLNPQVANKLSVDFDSRPKALPLAAHPTGEKQARADRLFTSVRPHQIVREVALAGYTRHEAVLASQKYMEAYRELPRDMRRQFGRSGANPTANLVRRRYVF